MTQNKFKASLMNQDEESPGKEDKFGMKGRAAAKGEM